MADFCQVWRCRGRVLEKLDGMLAEREAARDKELKAATDIKRVYRGKVRQPLTSWQGRLLPRTHIPLLDCVIDSSCVPHSNLHVDGKLSS